MNENHLVIAGVRVPIGPLLGCLMHSHQKLQDGLFAACALECDIPTSLVTIEETGGTVSVSMSHKTPFGLPSLTVVYSDPSHVLIYDYMGGDATEYLQKNFDSEEQARNWTATCETLPFANLLGEKQQVALSGTSRPQRDCGQWFAEATVWESCLDVGLNKEAQARNAARLKAA